MDIFTALWEQLIHNPVALLIILPVSILASVLEVWPWFNSKLIPAVCVLAGALLYPNLVSRGTVDVAFPNPLLVLVLYGVILGFVASVIHAFLIKAMIAKISSVFAGAEKTNKPSTP